MHFFTGVANLGYDELTVVSFGGTSPNFLNGLAGSGFVPMKHCKRSNNGLFLNYNKS
jgi:hypothetical protein